MAGHEDDLAPSHDAGAQRAAETLRWAARAFATASLAISLAAIFGYLRHLPMLMQVRTGWQGMSPVTALGLSTTACAVLCQSLSLRRSAAAACWTAAAIGGLVLAVYALKGRDVVSPWLAAQLFRFPADAAGRTSIATAASVLALGAAGLDRRSSWLRDAIASSVLLVSGVALLGYAYGVRDLYAVPIFHTMALNTALGLLSLSVATLLVNPRAGWASVIASRSAEGGATRRQLSFLILPPVAGWVLLRITSAAALGPAVAMAMLVILTVVPLALLIIRDGRMLTALEAERRTKAALQARVQGDLEAELCLQAERLTAESGERTKAEAALYRAQRMEAVGQLTGGIAHDFNNLLMAVGGNLQLLTKRLAEDHPARRFAVNATDAVDKGAKLTAQLLAFSRTQKLHPRPIELDPVLTSARALMGASLGPSIDVRLEPGAAGAWALTDPDQLELAILNLALNARDAMPGGGVITVSSGPCRARLDAERDEAEYVFVRVCDTGEGMSAEVAEKAVEPFFTTKERGKGTGLGLAQVYGFIRQCGGDLRIESEPGRGTTILLLLPCAAAPAERVAPGVQSAQPAPARMEERRRCILVIDDDDSVRAVIVDGLRMVGYEVIEARDGDAGLDALTRVQPAAAIIDFIMPGMNGAEVARRARQLLPDLPVIFVSGYFDTEALSGIAGATIMRKPVDLDGLQRTISSVLH